MKHIPIDKNQIKDAIDLRIDYFYEAYSELSPQCENELRKNMTEYFTEHLNKDCFVLIAEENGCKVSCAILSIHTKAPNKKILNGKYGEIYGVFTLNKYRNKGYATSLIKDLIEFSMKKELSYIELDASADGLGIYQKCGFDKFEDAEYTKMRYYFNK